MKNVNLWILVLSVALLFGCEQKVDKEKGAKAEKTATATQPEAKKQDGKAAAKEVLITVKEGAFEPNELQIVSREPVKLRFKSLDVAHTFTCPALGIDQKIGAGEEATLDITPERMGSFVFRCDIHGYGAENGLLAVR